MFDCFSINETQVKRLIYGIPTNSDELKTLNKNTIKNNINTLKQHLRNKTPNNLSEDVQTLMKYYLIYDETKITESIINPIIGLSWSGNICWLVTPLIILSSMKYVMDALCKSNNENCKFIFNELIKICLGVKNNDVREKFINKYYPSHDMHGGLLCFDSLYNLFDENVKKVLLLISKSSVEFHYDKTNKYIVYQFLNYAIDNANPPKYILRSSSGKFNNQTFDTRVWCSTKSEILFTSKVNLKKFFISPNMSYKLFSVVVGSGGHYYSIFFTDEDCSQGCEINGENITAYDYDIFSSTNELSTLCYVLTENKININETYNEEYFDDVKKEIFNRYHTPGYTPKIL